MGAYRLYFLNDSAGIVAAEVFDAARDADAITMSQRLADACGDACHGFELWQCDRRVAREFPAALHNPAGEITAAMEESLLQREEHIRNSWGRIAKSKKLLARIEEAHSKRSRTST